MNIFWVLRFCENVFFFVFFVCFFFGGEGVHHNIGLYLGAISMHFRVFFKVNVQNGEYFLVAKIKSLSIFLFFWGGGWVLEIPDIFFFWGG